MTKLVRLRNVGAVALAIFALAGCTHRAAVPALELSARESGPFRQFDLQPEGSSPQDIGVGPDGAVWVSLGAANALARLELGRAGRSVIEEAIPLGPEDVFPQGLHIVDDGSIWIAGFRGDWVGRVDGRTRAIRRYRLPRGAGPVMLVADPEGAVWFTLAIRNAVARLDPQSGEIREYPVPTSGGVPLSLRRASDGGLWFPEHEADKIARLDVTTGAIREYPLLRSNAGPGDVAFAEDGSVWFTMIDSGMVGRLDPVTGGIEEYQLSRTSEGGSAGPAILTRGPDDTLWFTQMYGNRLGCIDTRRRIVAEIDLPAPRRSTPARTADDDRPPRIESAGPGSLVFDGAGRLWYTAMFDHHVGYVVPGRCGERMQLVGP